MDVTEKEISPCTRKSAGVHFMTGTMWTASALNAGSAWHAVRKLGGWVLPTECGEWVCGPFHVRRGPRPAAALERAVCGECAEAVSPPMAA